jgi:catalase
MANTVKEGIKTRKIAILVADGFDSAAVFAMKKALTAAGAQAKIVSPRLGRLRSAEGTEVTIDFSLLTASSVLFDAVYIPGGDQSVKALMAETDAVEFISEAYKHCKTLAATATGVELIRAARLGPNEAAKNGEKTNKLTGEPGVITTADAQVGKVAPAFIKAIAQHRHWDREMKESVTAAG